MHDTNALYGHESLEDHGSFAVITTVPHVCIEEGDVDLPTSPDKMTRPT